MDELKNIAEKAHDIIITGHMKPDGDCVGACIAAYNYLYNFYPDKNIKVYLGQMPEKFAFLDPNKEIVSNELPEMQPDLVITFDSNSVDMLGKAVKLFRSAKNSVCIDHHISNKGYAKNNFIDASASSSCEILYKLMSDDDIDLKIAEALYMGIAFDTGVFRYSSTSKETMEIAGKLIEKGVPFYDYLDKCFYQRTYLQAQLLGRTLLTSMLLMDGKCVVAVITRRMMEFYEADTEDTSGIIEQLRITKGVEVAILLYETEEQEYKVSLRSNKCVDVNKIATYFGGGGHKNSAGFMMRGSVHDVINNITEHIEAQL